MLKETCIYVRTAVKAPTHTKPTAAQCDQEAVNRNPRDNRRNRSVRPDRRPYAYRCRGGTRTPFMAKASTSAATAFGDGVESAHAGLELHRNTTGSSFAGTPIAVQPAGTSLITNELAAIVASSPMVTAPMMLA